MTAPRCARVWLWLLFLGLGLMVNSAQAQAPAAPTDCIAVAISASGANATINVYWTDHSSNETSFRVEVSADTNPAFVFLGNAAANTSGFQWTGALINHIYRFRVFANNTGALSAATNVATVTTTDLGAPSNLRGAVVDSFNATLAWDEASTAEAGFAIESRVPSTSTTWDYLGAVGANGGLSLSPSLVLTPATTYEFRIRAFKGTAPSTPGSPVSATVTAYSNVITLVSPAYNLTTATVPCKTEVNLTWPNMLNETGYRVYRRNAGQSQYAVVATLGANVLTYKDTAVRADSPGTSFSYAVGPYAGTSDLGYTGIVEVTFDQITSKSGASSTPGAAFSHSFTHFANSSTGTVTSRTLVGTPSTLTFNSSAGTLTGTYPAVGNYTLTYTVNFSSGSNMVQTFYIRVRPPTGPPVVATTIPAWATPAGATRDTPLAGTFTDEEAESAVRVNTSLGDMDFILFDTATPATVTNFKNYLTRYADVVFHRSIAGFVIQGGGFKSTGTGSSFNTVTTDPAVVNEPGIPNLRGTVSMAKLGGNPNSATDQFFVSLADNRSNLDFQNGGFTVFGRVAGNGMNVADAISLLPTSTYNLLLDGSTTGSSFGDFPMNAVSAPAVMDQTKVVKMNSVVTIPTLTYTVTGNSNPTAVDAAVIGGQLHLTSLAGGISSVALTATDLDNQTNTQLLQVTVTDTFATWAARQTFDGGQNTETQNPDGDSLNNLLEYAFLGNPAVNSQTEAPTYALAGTAPAAQFMTLTFPVRKFTTGLSYAVEVSSALTGGWTTIWTSADGFTHAQVAGAVDQTDRTVVTIQDTAALTAGAKRFMRTRVTQL